MWTRRADGLAASLGTRVGDILGDGDKSAAAKQPPHAGPAGLVVGTFEEVRALPRHQQLKVVELVQALLEQYKKKAG